MCDCNLIQSNENLLTVSWARVVGEVVLFLLKTLCLPPPSHPPILPSQCPSSLHFQTPSHHFTGDSFPSYLSAICLLTLHSVTPL